MEKKAITELRKLFSKNNCRLDWISETMVSEMREAGTREIVYSSLRSFITIDDNLMEQYLIYLKGGLSGKFGRNLFNIEIPADEEQDGGKQELLYRLKNCADQKGVKQMTEALAQKIMESYTDPDRYMILIGHGIYDVPVKASDGATLEDGDGDTYRFLIAVICPITSAKPVLCCNVKDGSYLPNSTVMTVGKPETGFLFPAFNDRASDIHSALFYSKKGEERHGEIAEAVFGTDLPESEQTDKNIFVKLVQESLGNQCSFEKVKAISDNINELADGMTNHDADAPITISSDDIGRVMEESGADSESVNRMKSLYKEYCGKRSLTANNITDLSSMKIKSNFAVMDVKADRTSNIESRVIDGREYLLVPVSDDIEVNGIKIVQNVNKNVGDIHVEYVGK